MANVTIEIENAYTYEQVRDVLNALLAMKTLKEHPTIPDCTIKAGDLTLIMTSIEDIITEQTHIRLHTDMDVANVTLDDFGVRKVRAQ